MELNKLPAKEIGNVLKSGFKIHLPELTVLYKPNKNNFAYAVIVSKKTSKTAVGRNRIKRVIKEALHSLTAILPNWDVVIIGRSNCLKCKPNELSVKIKKAIKFKNEEHNNSTN